MINIADRLKPASRHPERTADDGAVPDSTRVNTNPGTPVQSYPAKNLVLKNGQYRVADHDK